MEPRLDEEDIQGHVFPGFGASYSVAVVLRLNDADASRTRLAALIPQVSTMVDGLRDRNARREAAVAGRERPSQTAPSLALALGSSALRSWGFDLSGFDRSFTAGMLDDAGALGDPVGQGGVPSDWTFATGDTDCADVLLVAAHSDRRQLDDIVDRWLDDLSPHLTPVLRELGHRRPDDREFFGFKDGVSQPAIRGILTDGRPASRRFIPSADPRSRIFAKPGQLLIWPGSFIFGYPGQSTVLEEPGALVEPQAPWMRNGSYLVFRRLLQDVPAFQSAVAEAERQLIGLGETVPCGWVAAKLVGRWPDGTPLTACPAGPDASISGDPMQINNFRFLTATTEMSVLDASGSTRPIPLVPADPLGLNCPKMSHIRQVNPRDGTSEIGSEHHPAKLMLRRGIAFGPDLEDVPNADRGLLFLSYQTSIVEQFRFVQATWANATAKPTGAGRDPLVGQDGNVDTQRSLEFFGPSSQQRTCTFDGRWVIATGGGYFVTPGISGLKEVLGVGCEDRVG